MTCTVVQYQVLQVPQCRGRGSHNVQCQYIYFKKCMFIIFFVHLSLVYCKKIATCYLVFCIAHCKIQFVCPHRCIVYQYQCVYYLCVHTYSIYAPILSRIQTLCAKHAAPHYSPTHLIFTVCHELFKIPLKFHTVSTFSGCWL